VEAGKREDIGEREVTEREKGEELGKEVERDERRWEEEIREEGEGDGGWMGMEHLYVHAFICPYVHALIFSYIRS